jgi:hypothetical protein
VHPAKEYHLPGILTHYDEDNQELYYVSPDLELPESLEGQTKITDLYAAQTHDGTFFIWWVNRSATSWFRAAQKALRTAREGWVRVVSRKGANTYDLYDPENPIPDPDWSKLPPFIEMVEDSFEGRLVNSLEHPLLRKLRGLHDDEQ